jgi:EpsI family protein
MKLRFFVAALFLLAAGITARGVGHGEPVKLAQPFAQFPIAFSEWRGRSMRLSGEVEKRVRVSDYLYRVYVRAPEDLVHFYVGFYESQRHGEMIHSPKNCLPGSGWYIASRESTVLDLAPYPPFQVNKFIVENGIERQIVLYWYQQAGGRIVTNEYLGRVHLVWDAFRLDRTDAALVRLSVPFDGSSDDALKSAVDFLREAYPRLMRFLPSIEVSAAS